MYLDQESGGHRWQRVPPTERKGRVHTSTVTVVVRDPARVAYVINEKDVDMRFTKDTGPGGQHRNKTESCVVLTHRPTGISVKAAERCQHANRRNAWITLRERVSEHYGNVDNQAVSKERRAKAGSGMRGDKIRTYAVHHHVANDHRSNIKVQWRSIENGDLLAFYE